MGSPQKILIKAVSPELSEGVWSTIVTRRNLNGSVWTEPWVWEEHFEGRRERKSVWKDLLHSRSRWRSSSGHTWQFPYKGRVQVIEQKRTQSQEPIISTAHHGWHTGGALRNGQLPRASDQSGSQLSRSDRLPGARASAGGGGGGQSPGRGLGEGGGGR